MLIYITELFVKITQNMHRNLKYYIKREKELLKEMIMDVLKMLQDVFDNDQLEEIFEGFAEGLTAEEIALYASPNYSWEQMNEIRKGIMHGLTPGKVGIFAKPEFEWFQMQLLRKGLELGLSDNQVMQYANPKLSCIEMESIKRELEENS